MNENVEEANNLLQSFFEDLTESIKKGESINHNKVREAKELLEEVDDTEQ